MAWTAISEDIPVKAYPLTFGFTASGTIKAGQAVYMIDDNKVKTTTGAGKYFDCIGIAAFDATDGDTLTVYGPGNLVRCAFSGTVAAGDKVYMSWDGKLEASHPSSLAAGAPIKLAGVAVDTSDDKVLLV